MSDEKPDKKRPDKLNLSDHSPEEIAKRVLETKPPEKARKRSRQKAQS